MGARASTKLLYLIRVPVNIKSLEHPEAGHMLSDSQIAQYHRDGYILLKNVFSGNEIATFMTAGRAHSAPEGTAISLLELDALKSLWRDSRLVTCARQLLGETPVYFGEGNYIRFHLTPGQHIPGRHIHHDAKGTRTHLFNRLHEPQSKSYPVLRFGIYLQDYTQHSGGLKVSPGSHLINTRDFDQSALPYVNVPSVPGDLICFCMRILHSPYGMLLRESPSTALSPQSEDLISIQTPGALRSAVSQGNDFH